MELYSFIGIVEFLNCSKLPAVSSTEKIKKEKTFLRSKSNISLQLILLGKLQDGFTVLLMTETKFGIILTLENNTNPFDLLGNCRSCQENWMNRGHEKTRLCLEHENKITFYLLFQCS